MQVNLVGPGNYIESPTLAMYITLKVDVRDRMC